MFIFYFWGQEKYQLTSPAQGGVEGTVRFLLTKNSALFFQLSLARDTVSGLNGSRGPGRNASTSFMMEILFSQALCHVVDAFTRSLYFLDVLFNVLKTFGHLGNSVSIKT